MIHFVRFAGIRWEKFGMKQNSYSVSVGSTFGGRSVEKRGLARYQPGRLGQKTFALLVFKFQYKHLTVLERNSCIINVWIL